MILETDLKKHIAGEVRFGAGDRAMYASDASNYRHVPAGVVIPKSVEDMAIAVEICARHNTPIVHRGGGTALGGQTVSTNAVVIDSSKYCNALLSIDPENRLATVEPGCVLDDLRNEAGRHRLTFGPDPSTHNHCTLGGMIGNNSCGVHSVMAGRTLDNVHTLEILTYDGTHMVVGQTPADMLKGKIRGNDREAMIYRALWQLQNQYSEEIKRRTPNIPRLVSGYRLEQLLPEKGFHVARALVGSESTCVSILRATLHLVPDPEKELIVAGFDTMAHAADAIPDILKLNPVACEAMDHRLVGYMKKKGFHTSALEDLPDGKAWLLIEAPGSDKSEARKNAERMKKKIKSMPHVVSCEIEDNQKKVKDLWEIRKSGLGATAWVPGMKRATWPGWEDSAVHPERIGEYTRKLRELLNSYGYHAAMYGHFGDGLIHMRVDFGLHSPDEVNMFRNFMEDASNLVTSLGGTLSGEHGDGQARSELLPKMYGETMMQAFAEFKAIWDPKNKMNPGNIVQPKKIENNLRFGPHFNPLPRETVFKYPDDQGDFRRAALRCVGVGECRRHDSQTMCPSYRATREERHSTRGRARMFQEMLQGNPVKDGWKSESVREALDLCLSCKACKTECPVNVDMATYKAEFYHHYYKDRLRPVSHYTIGNIASLSRMATLAPGLANLGTKIKWMKRLAGIHPDRKIPAFTKRTFRSSWQGLGNGPRGTVLLWADTFNNHFAPQVLKATSEIVQNAGYTVRLTEKNICCGRPFYDFGLLGKAKRYLQTLLDDVYPLLDQNTWIVGIEPSCIATFHDELVNIFPDDHRAHILKNRSMMLGDFLEYYTDYHPPKIGKNLIVHGHCYHKTLLGMDSEKKILEATGANVNVLDSGCCGMAGSFGYEKEKYPYSVTIAQQVLLPAIKNKKKGDLVVANGFSCRTQINELAGVKAWTLPEILTKSYERNAS